MKKILTLMAAMSAASGAFAFDYDWDVPTPSNIQTNDQGEVEKCKGLKYDATNNVLSFNAQAGDQILVSVQNLSDKSGSVSANGTSIVVDGNLQGVLNYTADADGLIKIVISGNLVVTKINVTSKMYLDLVKEYNDAKAALNDVNKQLAGYSTKEGGKFGDFFTAFMKEVNEQGQAIEKAKADLEDAKKANTVSANKDDISGRLDNATKIVKQIPTKVQDAETLYNTIVGTDAQASLDRIKKAEKQDNITAAIWNNGAVNNRLDYMWDFKKKDGKKVTYVKGDLKASWETVEIAAIKKDRNKILDDALAELNNYPDHYTAEGKTQADFQNAYAGIITSVDNMIARAIVERDYKANIEQIAKDADALDKVIAANSEVFKTDNLTPSYDNWKKDIKEINEFIKKTDNRQDFTQEELAANPVKKYTDADATLKTYKTELVKQAQAVLNKLVEDTQKELYDYMYKVVAKYENEPATQKEWQKAFAVEQDKLNKAETTVKDGEYDKLVVNYTTIKGEIETVQKTVNGYWGQTLGAQKGEVVNINNANAEKLCKTIDAVRADYNERIQHIQKWLGMQFINYDSRGEESEATIDIKNNLKKLFDIVLELDNTKKAIGEDVAAINKLVDGTDDAEFDPNNDKYRFFEEKAKNSEGVLYTKAIDDLKKDIEAEIKNATYTANKKAAEFLNGYSYKTNYLDVATALTYVTYAQTEVQKGYNNSEMSSKAYDAYNQAFNDVAHKRYENGNQIALAYIDNAKEEIAKRWDADETKLDLEKHTLADDIEEVIQKEYLNKVKAAVAAIQDELDSYKKQYATIGEMKVKWNFAKANEKQLQKEAEAVDKTIASDFITKKIEAMNTSIALVSENLENNALKATEQKSATDAAEKQFNEYYKLVTEFKTVTENNAAKNAADKKVEEIKNSIKAAQITLNEYRDEVKAEYTAKLSDIEDRLTAQESNIAKCFEEYTLGNNYEANIKGALESIDADIKQLLADAKNEQEGGNLDENGDGVVDIKDVNVVADKAAEGTIDTDTYYNFIDAYLKYISKK